MVILTDWYGDQQEKRLEKLGILKYFSVLYSAEKTKSIPSKDMPTICFLFLLNKDIGLYLH